MSETLHIWTVPGEHPALAGHFPGHPIVPGVLILDQAVRFAELHVGRTGLAWRVGNAKFLSPTGPGERLDFWLIGKPSGAIAFTVRSAEREVASGSLTPPEA